MHVQTFSLSHKHVSVDFKYNAPCNADILSAEENKYI